MALARHGGAEHPRGARGRRGQPHQHGDGGGLTGAVAAEEAGDRAGGQRERNTVDRDRGLVDLGQLVGAHDGFRAGIHGFRLEGAHLAAWGGLRKARRAPVARYPPVLPAKRSSRISSLPKLIPGASGPMKASRLGLLRHD